MARHLRDVLLLAEHLVKAYKRGPERVVALSNADFTLAAGELVALASGAK